MRVLYFIPRYDSAAMGNRIHAEVIQEWHGMGIDAEVLSLAAGRSQRQSTVEGGIRVHRLPVSAGLLLKLANRGLNLALNYPYLAGAALHYRRFLAKERYDLVHIETAFPLGAVAATVGRAQQPPIALTLPGADIMAEPEFDYGYGRFWAVRSLLPLIFRRATVIRADSPQLRELAIRLGAPVQRVVAIPYNITADSYPPPGANLARLRKRARDEIVARHQLDPQRPIVVSLSRLHPFKGVAYLVEAMPMVCKQGATPNLLIVGPSRRTARFGDYGAYLREQAAALGVSDRVHLVGGVEHAATRSYLAAADIVVIPSVAESFNRVAVEAAAVGAPVVVTRTTGVSAYVDAETTGLVVEPRSAAAIAEAILLLLGDGELWHNCSQRGPAMAAAFSSAAIAGALARLYRGTVGT